MRYGAAATLRSDGVGVVVRTSCAHACLPRGFRCTHYEGGKESTSRGVKADEVSVLPSQQ